jgi:hypothetical protein
MKIGGHGKSCVLLQENGSGPQLLLCWWRRQPAEQRRLRWRPATPLGWLLEWRRSVRCRRWLQPLAPLPLGWRPRWLVRRWRRRPGVPSGGSAGILLSWTAGDWSCLVSKQEKQAVPMYRIVCTPLVCWGFGSYQLGLSVLCGGLCRDCRSQLVGRTWIDFTRWCLSSVEDGAEAAGVSEVGMGCEDVSCGYLSCVEDVWGASLPRTFSANSKYLN